MQEILGKSVDWCLSNGLVIRPTIKADFSSIHAPFALLPSPFPRTAFNDSLCLQPLFNKLVDKLSKDHQFINSIMEDLSKVDDFMKRLHNIYTIVRKEGIAQQITLGIHRSDYLVHQVSGQDPIAQQVELNTIAASFSSLSTKVTELHQYILSQNLFDPKLYDMDAQNYEFIRENLPDNDSIHAVPKALSVAWEKFNNPQSVVLMVVQEHERNIFDQRFVEYELFNKYNIVMIRKTLLEIEKYAILDNQKNLIIDGKTIAITYFRAGYSPNDYKSEKEWDARLKIERSLTIKAPNIAYHIAGSKKIQQVLAQDGVVEKYISNPKECQLIRSSFAGLFPLDDSEAGKQAVKQALEFPEKYVMKPQREGGGNNIYGKDIPPFLKKLSLEERKAYILMELIKTSPLKNTMVSSGEMKTGSVITELGVYGIWVSNQNEVFLNEACGFLLRTKLDGTNEGGVATGFSVLDSPLLY